MVRYASGNCAGVRAPQQPAVIQWVLPLPDWDGWAASQADYAAPRGSTGAPVPVIPAAVRPEPRKQRSSYGVWPVTAVADCAFVCVQLDPVCHRLIAWTKLLMIAVPWMVRIDSG